MHAELMISDNHAAIVSDKRIDIFDAKLLRHFHHSVLKYKEDEVYFDGVSTHPQKTVEIDIDYKKSFLLNGEAEDVLTGYTPLFVRFLHQVPYWSTSGRPGFTLVRVATYLFADGFVISHYVAQNTIIFSLVDKVTKDFSEVIKRFKGIESLHPARVKELMAELDKPTDGNHERNVPTNVNKDLPGAIACDQDTLARQDTSARLREAFDAARENLRHKLNDRELQTLFEAVSVVDTKLGHEGAIRHLWHYIHVFCSDIYCIEK